MLIKALLTGSLLSVLAGSIVYYGTEGAIADAPTKDVVEKIDSTELAGGEVELEEVITSDESAKLELEGVEHVAEIDVEPEDSVDAGQSAGDVSSNTNLLNQYLKPEKSDKDKSDKISQPTVSEFESEILESMESKAPKSDKSDTPQSEQSLSHTNEEVSSKTREEKEPQSEVLPVKDVEKLHEFKRGQPKAKNLPRLKSNYSLILAEANKIEIPDLRDQAMLEIIDHALDRRHTGQAADIVAELSSPELRDTARARIGVSLANMNEAEAAFAVMDEIEIEELASPIRLEIISALMATRAERAQKKSKFSE